MHILDPNLLFTTLFTFSFSGEMGPDFSSKMAVKSLTSQQLVRIHQLFRQAKFDDPSGHVSDEVYYDSLFFTFITHCFIINFFIMTLPFIISVLALLANTIFD
jgi:hypothetical protein